MNEIVAEVLSYIDLYMRKAFSAQGEQRGQKIGCQRRDRADGDFSFELGVVADLLGCVIDLEQDLAGTFPQSRASLGEHSPATQTMKKLVPEFVFKINNLLTQRRLRHVAAFSCTGEVTVLGDSRKVTELV